MSTPNWYAIRDHYKHFEAKILAERADEWALDPYAWSQYLTLTPIEDWLWVHIRDANAIFYPQYPVGRFFVDFANPRAKVAIECDGAQYHKDKAKDQRRDDELSAMGWRVYRVPGYLCVRDNDHDTGRIREAARFVYRIVLEHGLSRNQSMNDMMQQALMGFEGQGGGE
ncbi:endonuclease domain-containing protein [Hydrogenophaga sp. T2]|uniref:endonuclease domain-containing protein n=1 Tax=Hydrogenophaga sp. T2 TaxID=3132823 RepID=UPI003CF40C6F